jgi:signal transduction histidine kinase/ligand-binding sensor domain-containing protein
MTSCKTSFAVSSLPQFGPPPRRAAALLFAFLCCFLAAPSQAQYRSEIWTSDTGLPQNIIRGLCQTPDKYLWIATLDGLAHFDGVHFTVFNKGNTPGIVSNRFEALHKGENGDLWLVTEGGRITRYHLGTFETYGPAQGLPDGPAHAVDSDAAGNIWFLFDSAIVQWNEQAGRFVRVNVPNPAIPYKPIRWESGGFWGIDNGGLHLFLEGTFATYPLPSWLPPSSIWSLARDQTGTIWIETLDGRYTSLPRDPSHPIEPPRRTSSISYTDRRGVVWTIRVGHHLSRSLDFISSGTPLSVPFAQIYEDYENDLWLGTDDHGLERLHEQFIRVYSKELGLVDRNVYPIYQDPAGTIWAGVWSSGLTRFKDGKWTNYTMADGLPNRLVTALATDQEGHFFVGTHGGLVTFVNGKFVRVTNPALPDDAVVQVMYRAKDTTMWFGTTNGLFSTSHDVTKTLTKRDGLASDDVRAILEGWDGSLWVAGYGGLTQIRNGVLRRWTEQDGLPSDNIRALYEDADHVLWIGTYDNGLARLENGKFKRYSTGDGLFDQGVFQILEDRHGNFWISCNRGIYRVSKIELNRFASGSLSKITSVGYGKIDGMLNIECNGGLSPAGIKTASGQLWFPTQDGIAVIDPEAVPINKEPPPVLLESALVDRAPVSLQGALVIPAHGENLEIQYTAVTFINSDQTRFKYILEGLDSQWNEVGTRRVAYYGHIPPGKYVFRVLAGNSDGVWNTQGQSLPVIALAPFYRTWWFFTLLVLTAIFLTAMAWSYRLRQLKQAEVTQRAFSQQLIASQESERKRIAADLHDSIGQRLIVINNLALGLMRSTSLSTSNGKEAETLKEINSEASLAIEETRGISYNLRPFQLDRLGLNKAIEGLIRSVSQASGIRFSTDLDKIDDLFFEDLRINFFRIVQESLNNIMKHSRATDVKIVLRRSDSLLTLAIEDNGRGFKPANRPAPTGQNGFGLTGMAERARLLGGTLEIRPGQERGTLILVEIPLGEAHHVHQN